MSNPTHGLSHIPTYRTWCGIRERCLSPSSTAYALYGGRGIKIDRRWEKFEQFFADMGERPPGMWIERRNVNGNYSKENCYWATPKEQGRNRRTNLSITYRGETHCLSEWCERLGIRYRPVVKRMLRGWDFESAISVPLRKYPNAKPIEVA